MKTNVSKNLPIQTVQPILRMEAKIGIIHVHLSVFHMHSFPETILLSRNQIFMLTYVIFRKVALILLQSESTDPPPPENLEIQDSPPLQSAEENTDVAFIAKTFEMDNFKNDELEILLRESKSRRKKRATDVDVPLRNNATYRFTQRNEDKTGVSSAT